MVALHLSKVFNSWLSMMNIIMDHIIANVAKHHPSKYGIVMFEGQKYLGNKSNNLVD